MKDWFEESFGSDYLLVYKHRDLSGAQREVERMIGWLDLPVGADVLDLCCGMGRHALALSAAGYKVTGVDLSGVLLSEAQRLDEGKDVRWVQGDMRQLPIDGPYDAVVNLFTSFGYFDDDAESARVLGEMNRVLGEGGRWLLDYLNPTYVQANLVPFSQRTEGDVTIEESRRIEDGFVRKTIVLRQPGAPDRTYREQVRLFSREQLAAMAESAGLALEAVYGDYEEGPYLAEQSPRMIFVGRKGAAHK
ncbi:class I SAM-dependent methyltransferase [Paenibacillus sp. y28]|uniref:class I SAM-dependent methyltransferase n=1 Tax=Paenibacillus sp. y28 TaxID=3129110 RepID=UPI003017149F